MKVAYRIAREYVIQLVGFAVALADRILVTGVLLRYWGVKDFAVWSVLVSAAGMLAVFDVGVNAYFVNRSMMLVQQGRLDEAQRSQRDGNTITFTTSFVGVVIVLAGFGMFSGSADYAKLTPWVWATVIMLTLATWLRMAIGVQAAVYRAHEEFGRGSMWIFGIDGARIAITVIAVLLSARFIEVAALQLAVTMIGTGMIAFWDTPRRYPGFGFGFGILDKGQVRETLFVSFGYWIQSAPNALLTYMPIFLLTGSGVGGLVVAQFVLMRTVGNLIRQVLQLFAVVLGQEAARRLARGEMKGLAKAYRESSRLLTVQSACAAGGLIAIAGPLFGLWTGKGELYDPILLIWAVLPPMIVPSAMLAQTFLGSANHPYPLAIGRVLQIAITVAAFYTLPIGSEGERMLAAIGCGEVIGFALPITGFVRRFVPSAGYMFQVELAARSLACIGVLWLLVKAALQLVGGNGFVSLLLGLLVATVGTLAMTALLGVDRGRVRIIWLNLRSFFNRRPA